MPIKITLTKRSPVDDQSAEFMHAFDRITAFVDQLADLDPFYVANALCSVAANVMVDAGLTHDDVADLLDVLASLSRHAECDLRIRTQKENANEAEEICS